MARYTGPTSKIARKFKEPIYGPDRALDKKPYPPGQHGTGTRRSKKSEYSVQLAEKQKIRSFYGVLEQQFRKHFAEALRRPVLLLAKVFLDGVAHRLRFGDRFGFGLDPKPRLAAWGIANVSHDSSQHGFRQ